MKPIVTACALLLFATPVLADDHLEPESSVYAGNVDFAAYDHAVVTVLSDAFSSDVRARMVALPSFQPEFAVGVIGDPGAYRIFAVAAKIKLWYHLQDHTPSRYDLEQVAVERCEVPVADALAGRILASWKGELTRVRFGDDPHRGMDGVIFHFAMFDSGRLLAGQVWSPPAHTAPWLLADLAGAMADDCTGKDTAALERAETELETYRSSQH